MTEVLNPALPPETVEISHDAALEPTAAVESSPPPQLEPSVDAAAAPEPARTSQPYAGAHERSAPVETEGEKTSDADTTPDAAATPVLAPPSPSIERQSTPAQKKFSSTIDKHRKLSEKAGDAKIAPPRPSPVNSAPIAPLAAGPRLLTGKLSGPHASGALPSSTSRSVAPSSWAAQPPVPQDAFASFARGGGPKGVSRAAGSWTRPGGQDFPSPAEAARNKELKAQAIAAAAAAKDASTKEKDAVAAAAAAAYHKQVLEGIDSFRGHAHGGSEAARWAEMDDEDEGEYSTTIDFGDGVKYSLVDTTPAAERPKEPTTETGSAAAAVPTGPQDEWARGAKTENQRTLFNDRLGKFEPAAQRQRGPPKSRKEVQLAKREETAAPAAPAAPVRPPKPAHKPKAQPIAPPQPVDPSGPKRAPTWGPPAAALQAQQQEPAPQPKPVESAPKPVDTSPKPGSKEFAQAQASQMQSAAERAKARRKEEEERIAAAQERARLKAQELERQAAAAAKEVEAAKSVEEVPPPLEPLPRAVTSPTTSKQPLKSPEIVSVSLRTDSWRARDRAPEPVAFQPAPRPQRTPSAPVPSQPITLLQKPPKPVEPEAPKPAPVEPRPIVEGSDAPGPSKSKKKNKKKPAPAPPTAVEPEPSTSTAAAPAEIKPTAPAPFDEAGHDPFRALTNPVKGKQAAILQTIDIGPLPPMAQLSDPSQSQRPPRSETQRKRTERRAAMEPEPFETVGPRPTSPALVWKRYPVKINAISSRKSEPIPPARQKTLSRKVRPVDPFSILNRESLLFQRPSDSSGSVVKLAKGKFPVSLQPPLRPSIRKPSFAESRPVPPDFPRKPSIDLSRSPPRHAAAALPPIGHPLVARQHGPQGRAMNVGTWRRSPEQAMSTTPLPPIEPEAPVTVDDRALFDDEPSSAVSIKLKDRPRESVQLEPKHRPMKRQQPSITSIASMLDRRAPTVSLPPSTAEKAKSSPPTLVNGLTPHGFSLKDAAPFAPTAPTSHAASPAPSRDSMAPVLKPSPAVTPPRPASAAWETRPDPSMSALEGHLKSVWDKSGPAILGSPANNSNSLKGVAEVDLPAQIANIDALSNDGLVESPSMSMQISSRADLPPKPSGTVAPFPEPSESVALGFSPSNGPGGLAYSPADAIPPQYNSTRYNRPEQQSPANVNELYPAMYGQASYGQTWGPPSGYSPQQYAQMAAAAAYHAQMQAAQAQTQGQSMPQSFYPSPAFYYPPSMPSPSNQTPSSQQMGYQAPRMSVPTTAGHRQAAHDAYAPYFSPPPQGHQTRPSGSGSFAQTYPSSYAPTQQQHQRQPSRDSNAMPFVSAKARYEPTRPAGSKAPGSSWRS